MCIISYIGIFVKWFFSQLFARKIARGCFCWKSLSRSTLHERLKKGGEISPPLSAIIGKATQVGVEPRIIIDVRRLIKNRFLALGTDAADKLFPFGGGYRGHRTLNQLTLLPQLIAFRGNKHGMGATAKHAIHLDSNHFHFQVLLFYFGT